MHKTASIIATCAGIGNIKGAPGTYGSLLGVVLAAVLMSIHATAFIIATLILTAIGTWAAHIYAKNTQKNDPKEVIIDEVIGQWFTLWSIALGLVPFNFLWLAIAFVLFRAFDILKPFPINLADKHIKGGVGIIIDDIIAAIFACIIIAAINIAT